MIQRIRNSSILKDISYLFILLIIPFCRYWRLFSSNVLDHRWFSSVDMISQYADRFYFYKNLKNGILALWHPNLTGGFPLFANVQDGLFYPFNLLDFLTMKKGILVFGHVNTIEVIHYSMAGIFMYLCVRAFKLSRFASFVAGLSYMLCGFFWAHINHIEIIAPASYLPLIFMQIYLSFEKKSIWYAIFAGFVLGMAFLYSHPPTIFYMLFFIGFYVVFKFCIEIYQNGWSIRSLLYPGFFVMMLVVFVGVTAVQLFPTIEITMFNPRLSSCYDWITRYTLDFRNIFSIVIPWLAQDWEWGIDETYGYLGLLPIYLAMTALVLFRSRLVFFFSGMALLSAVLLLGKNTFIFSLFYNFFPGMSLFRIPPRFLYLLSISVAFLSAYGIEGLIQKSSDGRRKSPLFLKALSQLLLLFIGIALLLQIIGATGISKISGQWIDYWNFFLVVFFGVFLVLKLYQKEVLQEKIFKFLIAFLIVFDLTGATINVRTTRDDLFNPTLNRNSVLYDHPHIKFLQKQSGLFRVKDDIGIVGNLGYIENLYDIPCLGHNQNDPMRLEYYTEFIKAASDNPRLWDFLNAKFLLTRNGLEGQSLEKYNAKEMVLDRINFQKDFVVDEWTEEKNFISINILSYLKESVNIPQDTTIAEIQIVDQQDHMQRFPIRAGIETAEMDYDRADLMPLMKHRKATIASSWYKEGTGFKSYVYSAQIKIEQPVIPKGISVRYLSREGSLTIKKMELDNADLLGVQDRYKQVFPNVYENKYVMPRVFLVPQAAVIPDDELRLRVLENVEPARIVLLQENPLGYQEPKLPLPDLKDARVVIEEFLPDRILMKTNCSERSFLVTSEVWYPGWKAYIDGKEAKIYRANHSFRSLYLDQGNHVIEMVFDPFSFKLGLMISIATIILLGLSFILLGLFKVIRKNKN